jgi:DNA-binding PadR family transcriptional regulator
MSQTSDFRRWVEELWRENCEERKAWREDQQSIAEYFARYKWWLRREFRYQTKDSK